PATASTKVAATRRCRTATTSITWSTVACTIRTATTATTTARSRWSNRNKPPRRQERQGKKRRKNREQVSSVDSLFPIFSIVFPLSFPGVLGVLAVYSSGFPCRQRLSHLCRRFRVEHIAFFQPAAPRHVHAVAIQRELLGAVRIGVYHQFD